MKFQDLKFRDYYQQFVVVEADALTERCKGKIEIQEDDCFLLCYGIISKNKRFELIAISVGKNWQQCDKGLYSNEILASFYPEELFDMQVQMYENISNIPSVTINLLADLEMDNFDLQLIYEDVRFDGIRNQIFPNVFLVGILEEDKIIEVQMEALYFEGPFIVGRFYRIHHKIHGIQEKQLVRALPYWLRNHYRLLAIFIGDVLNEYEQEAFHTLMEQSDKIGLDLLMPHRKN